MVRAGTHLLVTVLWHYSRFDRWPTTQEFSRMASWRAEHRSQGLEWVREMEYLVKDRDDTGVIHRVTEDGRAFVTLPSMVVQDSFDISQRAMPDNEDELQLVNWLFLFHKRRDKWPTPWHYQQCGLYQRSTLAFHEAVERLVQQGRLARIHIRRGRRNVTRLVDTAYCPQFEGRDGHIYFWSTAAGPFPEP